MSELKELAAEALKDAVTSGTAGVGGATYGGAAREEDEEAVSPEEEDEVAEKAARAASSVAKGWTGPHEGPRGGIYWLHTETGERRYQEGRPGESDEAGEASTDESSEVVDSPPPESQGRVQFRAEDVSSQKSLEEAGVNNPNSNITLGVTDDGQEVFIRETSPQTADAMVANEGVLLDLGLHVPAHRSYENGIMTQGIDGKLIRQRPENVDRDELIDVMAGNILAGNWDLHSGNLIVDEDGQIWTIDTDQGGSPLSMVQEYAWPSSEIMRSRVGPDIEREGVERRIEELANGLDIEAALDGVRSEVVRENIREIVAEARTGEFALSNPEPERGEGGVTII